MRDDPWTSASADLDAQARLAYAQNYFRRLGCEDHPLVRVVLAQLDDEAQQCHIWEIHVPWLTL